MPKKQPIDFAEYRLITKENNFIGTHPRIELSFWGKKRKPEPTLLLEIMSQNTPCTIAIACQAIISLKIKI